MYITLDQLILMVSNLSNMKAGIPEDNKDEHYKLHIMISTVVGMIDWIETRAEAEREGKCPDCGGDHSMWNKPDHRSN